MVKIVYLIRHGESIHNEEDKLSGITDVPLSERGRRQCEKLRLFFANKQVDLVYSSPLSRAVESAKIIFPGKEILIAPELIEIDYGRYEGVSRDENDHILQQWNTSPAEVQFPGGKKVREHAEQVYLGFIKIIRDSGARQIACISHRTTMRLIVAQVLGLDLNLFRQLPCSNCSITEIVYKGDRLYLNSLNVTPEYLLVRG